MPTRSEPEAPTYPMRVVSRMTRLSPERLRAWESRYAAIRPERTEGGTRRYTDAHVARLRLLRQVTESGHRIGDVVRLDDAALHARLPAARSGSADRFAEMQVAVDALDAARLRQLLEARRHGLDPLAFARDEVLPLAEEIGRRWASGRTSVAAEHRATNVLRSLLVEAVDEGEPDVLGPRVVFGAPEGERHDLGVLTAAIASRAFGAQPIFVGADVPEADLVDAAVSSRADALALGFVVSPASRIESTLRAVRAALPQQIALWIGGRAIVGCAPIRGVDRIEHEARLEAFVLEARRSASPDANRDGSD